MVTKTGIKIRLIAIIGILVVIAGIAGFIALYKQSSEKQIHLHTYFQYSPQEVERLKSLSSDKTMSVEETFEWDERMFGFVESLGLTDVDAAKLYAYENIAQLDAAALSYQAHGKLMGDFSGVTREVLCQLYKVRCNEVLTDEADAYSKLLAEIIVPKVSARIAEENRNLKPAILKKGPQDWNGPAPQTGLAAPSYKTWLLSSASQFRAAAPPAANSVVMRDQLGLVQQALTNITLEQKNIIVQWAGGPGTITPPGQWLDRADLYMMDSGSSLDTFVNIRAALSTAIADATIAAYDSKYYYQTPRPSMVDKSIVTIMPVPNHPSYPAGHATISWAAATVLSHYFPANQEAWERDAKQAGDSRVLGGIHFPVDVDAGTAQGKNVGNEIIRKWR